MPGQRSQQLLRLWMILDEVVMSNAFLKRGENSKKGKFEIKRKIFASTSPISRNSQFLGGRKYYFNYLLLECN